MRFPGRYWVGLIGLLALVACDREPVGTGPLQDPAGLIKAGERPRLIQLQQRLLREFDINLQVMILDRRPADLDYSAATLFDRYLFKNPSRGARGILLLVDPQGKRMRMVTGYDLAEDYPPSFVAFVEERQMAPYFAESRVAEGLTTTLELLVGQARGGIDYLAALPDLSDSPNPADQTVPGEASFPGDGRAERIAEFGPQSTPLAALAAYRKVLRSHLRDPELELYTAESRQVLRRWLVSEAQQDNELRSLDRVLAEAEVIVSGSLAVIRFPVVARQNAPYFLRRQQSGWQLDLAARNRVVRFNTRSQWHFDNLDHGFMFAFGDWLFDADGYPHRRADRAKF